MTEALEGLGEWADLSELIRGLVHALNNRLTALSAFAELAALGDEEFAPAKILPAELVRLQRVSALLRLLLSEETPAEALEIGALLDDALALYQHLPYGRTARCEVVREGAPTPVRVSRWRMLRLLLVLIESGRRTAEATGQERFILRLAPFDDGLLLQVEAADVTPYARTMAAECSATIAIEARGATVRLPSLAALRRQERVAADPDRRAS
jgi:hypothetical protein